MMVIHVFDDEDQWMTPGVGRSRGGARGERRIGPLGESRTILDGTMTILGADSAHVCGSGRRATCKKNMAKGNDQIIMPMSGVPIIRLFTA